MQQLNTRMSPEAFDAGLNRLLGRTVAPQAIAAPVAEPVMVNRRTVQQPKPKPRKGFWTVALKVAATVADFLSRRARDLALVLIVVGTGVAVFQGSLTSATLFGFTGWSAIAFALMPDALMVISASKMREKGVSPAQRIEAKRSMYFGLGFSLASNMIAALYITLPELFTTGVLVGGAVAYHASTVVFLWRAVETVTKTREDAPTVKGRNASKRPAAKRTGK